MALYNEAKEAKKLLSQLINQCVLENETVKSCIKARRAVVTTAANTTVANRVGVKLIGDNTELFLPYNPVFAPDELVKGMIVSVWYNYSLNNGIVMQDAKWQQGGNASGGQEFDPAGTYPELTSGKATADAAGNTITSFYAHGLKLDIDNSTFVITATLIDGEGNTLSSEKIDLPLESVVVDGEFNAQNDTIELTLQNGNTIDIPVGDLIDGLASQTEVDNIVNGSTTVGKAANVTSQINGHAISDIFESDGTTVKNASEAEILTDGLSVGNSASSTIQGYYQFLTAPQLDNYQQTNIRLEFTDTNIANYPESICGIELRYYHSPTAPNGVDVYVLYGNPDILNNVWVSVTANNGIALYFYSRGRYSSIHVKAFYQGKRSLTNADNFNIFENTTSYIAELPADNTNTALPDLEHYSLITQAESAINDGDGNQISTTYAKQNGTYQNLMAGGVQAELLANNSSLNSCIPDEIGMWKMWYVSTDGNAQTITDKPTGVTTAFKVEAIRILEVTGGARVIQRLNDMRSNEFARYGAENGSGGTNFQAWKEIVTADGSYPTLGAGYLAKQHSLRRNTTTAGWLKIGTVPSSTFSTYVDYSCIMLIHGIFRGSLRTTAPKTAIIEIEVRKYPTSVGDQRIGIIAGDIPTDRLCYVIEDNLDMSIYLYDNYMENVNYSCEIISEYASRTGASDAVQYNVFEWGDSPAAALPSAPSGAVYAVNRNRAAQADKLSTAGTIRTNLASTSSPTYTNGGNITPGVTGILPYANGGLGSNNFSNTQGILTAPASSSDTVHSLPRGTTGQVLTARSNNVPQWTNQSALNVGYATNAGFANEAEHADSADSAGNATNLGGRPASDYITVDDTDIEKAVIIDTDQTVTGQKIFTNELNAFYGIAFEAGEGGSFAIGRSYGETSPIGTTVYGARSITRYNTSNIGVMAQIQLDSSMEYTARSHEFNGTVYLPSNTYLGISQGTAPTIEDYVVSYGDLIAYCRSLIYTNNIAASWQSYYQANPFNARQGYIRLNYSSTNDVLICFGIFRTSGTITFPRSYSFAPFVLVAPGSKSDMLTSRGVPTNVTTTNFTTNSSGTYPQMWLSIGLCPVS